MSELTRRDFIKLAGAAAAMTALPGSVGAAGKNESGQASAKKPGIYTLDGRPVGGWKFISLSDSQATLDVSSLPDGIYILSLRTANGVATKKLTVAR